MASPRYVPNLLKLLTMREDIQYRVIDFGSPGAPASVTRCRACVAQMLRRDRDAWVRVFPIVRVSTLARCCADCGRGLRATKKRYRYGRGDR